MWCPPPSLPTPVLSRRKEILASNSDNSAKTEIDDLIDVQEEPPKSSTPLKGAENFENRMETADVPEKPMDLVLQKTKGETKTAVPHS